MNIESKDQVVADDTQLSPSVEVNQEQIQETLNPLLGLTKEQIISKLNLANAEAAKHRKRGSVYKQEMETKVNEELKQQGKYKEMYQQKCKDFDQLEGGLKRGMTISSLKDELLKSGCTPSMVDKAIKHADIADVDVDPETMRPDADQISFIAKHVKEEVPVFFSKSVGTVKDGVPGSPIKGSSSNSIKDMSDADLEKAYKGALASL